VKPDSCKNCGICVDLPLPVSATIIRALFCSTALIICRLNAFTGKHAEAILKLFLEEKKPSYILHDRKNVVDLLEVVLQAMSPMCSLFSVTKCYIYFVSKAMESYPIFTKFQ
jgi:hypothetical protein